MAHMIEANDSMFSVRQKPWHYAETADRCKIIADAPNSAEALRLAGLDWNVIQEDVFLDDGTKIHGVKANLCETDKTVLGIVSDRYRIIQNVDAFDFTDNIIGDGVTYETAGSLCGKKKIWLLARMPETSILGDKVEPYMVFSNSFDGKGAIQVALTPIRVVCNNTLNLALNTAKRGWSTKHVGDLKGKMEEAKMCLQLANDYMNELSFEAERLANKKLMREQIDEILTEMFPTTEDMTERKKANIQELKDSFYVCYYMPDIAQFKGTAWGAVNAMADLVDHSAPKRNTSEYEANRWDKIMGGHAMLDQFVKLVNEKVSV